MLRALLFPFVIFFFCSAFGQEKVKYRKLDYTHFYNEFGINDTARAVMDIYFDKRENAAFGQMSFLPITAGLAIIPQTRVIGIVTTAISLPLFIHGGYTLIRFRKKKLNDVLTEYSKTKTLPKWLQKKVDKQLASYLEFNREY